MITERIHQFRAIVEATFESNNAAAGGINQRLLTVQQISQVKRIDGCKPDAFALPYIDWLAAMVCRRSGVKYNQCMTAPR